MAQQINNNFTNFVNMAVREGQAHFRAVQNRTDTQLLNDVFLFVTQGRQFNQKTQMVKFWTFDYNIDVMSRAMLEMTSSAHFDRFKRFRINPQNQGQTITQAPFLIARDQVIGPVQSLAQVFRIVYFERNNVIQNAMDTQIHRFMLAMMDGFFGNAINDLMTEATQDLNLVQLQFKGTDVTRNFISIQCAIQYAGISDLEFMKASFIYYIVKEIIHAVSPLRTTFVTLNAPWFIIYFASVMQNVDMEVRRKMIPTNRVDFFNSESIPNLAPIERRQFQRNFIDPSRDQDNIIIQDAQIFQIRTPFTRIFQVSRRVIDSIQIQGRPLENLSNDQRFAIAQMHGAIGNPNFNLEDHVNIDNALQGRLFEIVAQIFMNKMNEYERIIRPKRQNFRFMMVITTVVFQVPIPVSNDDQIQRVNSEQFNQAVANPQLLLDKLRHTQIVNNEGWSRYFTINITRIIERYEDILRSLEVTQSFIKRDISNQICQMIETYSDDSADNSLSAAVIAIGFKDSMIRSVRIRPVSIYRDQTRINLRADMVQLNTVQPQLPDNQNAINFNFNEVFEQPRRSQRGRIPAPDIDEFRPPAVRRQRNALLTKMDITMESLYNNVDQRSKHLNCCQRVAIQVQKRSSLKDQPLIEINSFEELFRFIHMIEEIDECMYIKSISYEGRFDEEQALKITSEMNENQLLMLLSSNHVFCCDRNGIRIGIMNKVMQKTQTTGDKKFHAKMFPCKSALEEAHEFASGKYTKFITASRIRHNNRRARVFFDFETTFDDLYQSITRKGVKQRQGLQSFEQVEFAFSAVIDVKIRFRTILVDLIREMFPQGSQIQLQSRDFIHKSEIKRWGLNCAGQLLADIENVQSQMNAHINEYSKDLHQIMLIADKCKNQDLSKHVESFIITNEIIAYSYNGAKFDNHFILSAIKNKHGDDWYKFISFIGDVSDMKVLKYKSIEFADLKLMTGGQSLKQFCKDLKIDSDNSKKDIDISKMRLYSIALDNKDEIMEYVMNDSRAIYQIHKKFEKSIRQIIQDISSSGSDSQKKTVTCKHIFSQATEYLSKIENNKKKIKVYKLLKGYFNRWFTISSLSMTIFKKFFNKHCIESTPSLEIYKFMQNAYQGGYTQAFVVGEVPSDQKVFYYDYNSMYPAIMARLPVPTNLSMSVIEERNAVIRAENVSEIGLDLNMISISTESDRPFGLRVDLAHFDLFELSDFQFQEQCLAPQFGLRTKLHGTVYPKRYTSSENTDNQLLCPVTVFGFQICEAFRNKTLVQVTIRRIMKIRRQTYTSCIFKEFDTFMYEARLEYKKEENATMAQCVKLFINSLYGKFGEKHHDLNIIVPNSTLDDEEEYKSVIKSNLKECHGFIEYFNSHDDELFRELQLKNIPLFDLNDRDSHLSRINVSKIPMDNSHVGSFVFYAALITAIGRTWIMNIANGLRDDARVFYIDTDSIVLNDAGSKQLTSFSLAEIDGVKLGALKNEYPFFGIQQETAIERFVVFNKKIYQYMIDGKWTNKFKGCRNANDDMRQAFMTGNCKYAQKQQRFKKNNANVTIIDFEMTFKLRLSRYVRDSGRFAITYSYDSLDQIKSDYGNPDAHLIFDDDINQWIVIQK